MPTDTGEVVDTELVITPASLEVLAAQANAAHEAVKELIGRGAREGQGKPASRIRHITYLKKRRGVPPQRVAIIRLNASR